MIQEQDDVHYQHFPHITESLYSGLGAVLDHWESLKIQGSTHAPAKDVLDALRDSVSNSTLAYRWNEFANTISRRVGRYGYQGALGVHMGELFYAYHIKPKDIATMAGCDFDRLLDTMRSTRHISRPPADDWRGELATIKMVHTTEKLTIKQAAHAGKHPYYHVLQQGGYIEEYTFSTCAVKDGINIKALPTSSNSSEKIAEITCNMPTHTLRFAGVAIGNGGTFTLTRKHLRNTISMTVKEKVV